VPCAGDIVVVDSGSEDKTVEIARRLGARVTVEPWRGFGKQKIRATALARYDWVLSLDADEALSPEALAEVECRMSVVVKASAAAAADNSTLNSAPTPDGVAFAFPRVTHHLGRWIRHGGMYPDFQTRLFHRGHAKWADVPVHEKIIADKVTRVAGDILHWSFEDISHQVATINRYSTLRSEQFRANGKGFSVLKLLFKPFGKFIEVYFWKRGFLDGRAGLIIAFVSSFATFLRWAKLYEIETVKDKTPKS
jgi:glycosyltransferase involved in cell wall biosynthesis